MSSFKKQVPNLLTLTRLLITPIVWWLLLGLKNNYLGLGFIILAGITDFLDGFLARKLKACSRLGYFLDHIVDTIYLSVVIYPIFRYLHPYLFISTSILTICVILLSPVALRHPKVQWPNAYGKTAYGFLIASGCFALIGGLPNTLALTILKSANIILVVGLILRFGSIILFLKEVFKKF